MDFFSLRNIRQVFPFRDSIEKEFLIADNIGKNAFYK